jgi:hypothetical protein
MIFAIRLFVNKKPTCSSQVPRGNNGSDAPGDLTRTPRGSREGRMLRDCEMHENSEIP